MAELSDYLNSINQTKRNLMRTVSLEDDPKIVSGYPTFIVRRLLSYQRDCMMDVDAINSIPGLDPQMQYEYLLHVLPKRKRFAKLVKADPSPKLALIKEMFGYNEIRGLEVLDLFTDHQFEEMERALSKGGLIDDK